MHIDLTIIFIIMRTSRCLLLRKLQHDFALEAVAAVECALGGCTTILGKVTWFRMCEKSENSRMKHIFTCHIFIAAASHTHFS